MIVEVVPTRRPWCQHHNLLIHLVTPTTARSRIAVALASLKRYMSGDASKRVCRSLSPFRSADMHEFCQFEPKDQPPSRFCRENQPAFGQPATRTSAHHWPFSMDQVENFFKWSQARSDFLYNKNGPHLSRYFFKNDQEKREPSRTEEDQFLYNFQRRS